MFYRVQKNNRGLSFGTIAGSGKNGAYIHYSPANLTNNAVNTTNMLLLDSGGQYLYVLIHSVVKGLDTRACAG